MQKEEVLKLEYLKINDDYTIATIVYQNDEILKRHHFKDYELGVKSFVNPEFVYPNLYVRGYKTELDNLPITIPNEHLEFVKEKVRKLNEKYGIPKKWCPDIGDDFYSISFNFTSNVCIDSWCGDYVDDMKLSKNLIFKTKEEAQFIADKMLENVDKWREEYQKGE